ncbi:MAG: hypothetical protein ACHBN1_20120 [Heteroscytonema crispum UTEX LB 1556]
MKGFEILDERMYHQPNGRTSYLRECYQKRSTRFTTNHYPPPTNIKSG